MSVSKATSAVFPGLPKAESKAAILWEVRNRARDVFHFERKLYHFLMGMGCFALYAFILNQREAILLLATIGGALVFLDVARLFNKDVQRIGLQVFGKVMRREELRRLSASSFYVLGLLLIVIVFPKPVVLLSVLYLAVGDPVAAIVGTLYGRQKILGKKSLQGSLANFIVSLWVTVFVCLSIFNWDSARAVSFALIGATISVIAEICPFPVDDNFSIPVLSATLLSFAYPFFS